MAEIFQKNGRICVEGTEVLRWRISLPLYGDAIASFYGELGARAVGYCEGALTELATREFEGSEEANKRFDFPFFSYRLAGRVTYEDERYFSVCLVAELRRRGAREVLGYFESGQVWEKESEQCVPPEQLVTEFCHSRFSRREKKRVSGILLSSEGALWYDGGTWRKKEIFGDKTQK